jgi:O-antigen/teichoic acid export membrane protein
VSAPTLVLPTTPRPSQPSALDAAPARQSRLAALLADPILQKASVSIADQAIVSLAGFATSVIIGRACGKAELGVYYLALSIILLARGIQEQLVSAPYMIYASRRRGDALASYSGSALVHQWTLTVLIVLALAGAAAAIHNGSALQQLGPVAWVMLAAAPLMLTREFIRQFAFAHLQLGTAVFFDFAVSTLQVGLLLVFAWTGHLNVVLAYCIIAAAAGVASLAWIAVGRHRFTASPGAVVADWRHNWAFGKWALASLLVGSTSPYFMPWILALAHGEAAAGLLGACTALVGLANMFVMGLSNFLSPKAARAYADGGVPELRRVLYKIAALFLAGLGTFCLVAIFAGEPLALLVYGDRFAGAGPVIALLACGMLVSSLGITAGNGLWALERPSANFAADLCSLTVTLAAAVALVPTLGVVGAAISTLAGTSAGTIVRLLTLRRLMKSQSLSTGAMLSPASSPG